MPMDGIKTGRAAVSIRGRLDMPSIGIRETDVVLNL